MSADPSSSIAEFLAPPADCRITLAADERRPPCLRMGMDALSRSASPRWSWVGMWEQITQADIERARKELSLKRAETLRRQAEEIEGLDAQFQDIERFEGVVAAFVEEFMSPEIAPAVSGE